MTVWVPILSSLIQCILWGIITLASLDLRWTRVLSSVPPWSAPILAQRQRLGLRSWPPPLVISRRIWGGAVNQHSLGLMQPQSPPGVPSGRGIRTRPTRLLQRSRAMITGRCSPDRPFVLDLSNTSPHGWVNYNSQGPVHRA